MESIMVKFRKRIMLQLNGRSLTQRFPKIQIVNILLISMNNWSEVINEVERVTFHNTLQFIEFYSRNPQYIPKLGLGMKMLGLLSLQVTAQFATEEIQFHWLWDIPVNLNSKVIPVNLYPTYCNLSSSFYSCHWKDYSP